MTPIKLARIVKILDGSNPHVRMQQLQFDPAVLVYENGRLQVYGKHEAPLIAGMTPLFYRQLVMAGHILCNQLQLRD